MKILLYGLNYAPELTGIGKYSGELGAWLASRGHEVRVITTPPYYPAWRVDVPYRASRYRRELGQYQEVIVRCPLYVPKSLTGVRRILHLLSFAVSSLPVLVEMLQWKPDAIFTVEPTFFCTPGALAFSLFSGAASWLHIQDFEIDAAFDLGFLPPAGKIRGFVQRIETFLMRRFDAVSSISPNMVASIRKKGVPQEKAKLFPNWVDTDGIRPLGLPNEFRQRLNLDDRLVLLYSGNLGAKQGLEIFEPLCKLLVDEPSVHLLICGDGAMREKIQELAAQNKNVTHLPLQPIEQLNSLLNAADIHLLPQREDVADLVMPSKLTAMLASGRPVVAMASPGTQLAKVVANEGDEKAATGLIVPPGDVQALLHAIRTLSSDLELRERLGKNARKYAEEELGKEAILLRFEEAVKEIASENVHV